MSELYIGFLFVLGWGGAIIIFCCCYPLERECDYCHEIVNKKVLVKNKEVRDMFSIDFMHRARDVIVYYHKECYNKKFSELKEVLK